MEENTQKPEGNVTARLISELGSAERIGTETNAVPVAGEVLKALEAGILARQTPQRRVVTVAKEAPTLEQLELYTYAQAAEVLQVRESTIAYYVRQGKLGHVQIGKRRYIPFSKLYDFAQRGATSPGEEGE